MKNSVQDPEVATKISRQFGWFIWPIIACMRLEEDILIEAVVYVHTVFSSNPKISVLDSSVVTSDKTIILNEILRNFLCLGLGHKSIRL